MTSRNVGGQSFTLNYDAENRLVSVTGAATANFHYDADGKQIKATVNGVTTYYVGNHYEVKSSVVTKYYFAGATRIAVRTGGTLSYLLGDHLGSSSVTTDANGVKTASALYKAFGETRYTLGNLGTDYHFTGQREEAALGGIYWFQSRWMDPSLGRFTQPDTIVPTSTQGTQAWDRYAFVNNNPVRYTDPTGHDTECGIGQTCPEEEDEGGSNGSENTSSCTSDEGGTTCEIYVSPDQVGEAEFILVAAWVFSTVVDSTLLIGGGLLIGGVGGFVGGVASTLLSGYDAYTLGSDIVPDITGAATAGEPLKVTTSSFGLVIGRTNSDEGTWANTPGTILATEALVWLTTGNLLPLW
jgi:RHS repeat-associated protein